MINCLVSGSSSAASREERSLIASQKDVRRSGGTLTTGATSALDSLVARPSPEPSPKDEHPVAARIIISGTSSLTSSEIDERQM